MHTDHINTTPTLSITVYIMSILFFPFFLIFLAIFALLTIFGNVHRPCKQYPNIVNNSLHHVCSFFLGFFFPDFLGMFILITILGHVHRPCKQISNITTPSLFFGYYAMSGTSQKKSKNQKFKNSTVEKKNISLVQLTNAAISLLN